MHTEIKAPNEAKLQRAQRILSNLKRLEAERRRLARREHSLIRRACNLLDIPVVKLR